MTFGGGFTCWLIELISSTSLLYLGVTCFFWMIFSMSLVTIKTRRVSMRVGNIFNVVSFEFYQFSKKSKREIEFYNEAQEPIYTVTLDEGFEDDRLMILNHEYGKEIEVGANSSKIFVFLFNNLTADSST